MKKKIQNCIFLLKSSLNARYSSTPGTTLWNNSLSRVALDYLLLKRELSAEQTMIDKIIAEMKTKVRKFLSINFQILLLKFLLKLRSSCVISTGNYTRTSEFQ